MDYRPLLSPLALCIAVRPLYPPRLADRSASLSSVFPSVRVPFLVLTPFLTSSIMPAPSIVHYAGCYPASLPLMAVLTRIKRPTEVNRFMLISTAKVLLFYEICKFSAKKRDGRLFFLPVNLYFDMLCISI